MTAAIEINQLTKKYPSQPKGTLAIDNISLQIPAGILYALVGPDGAGKTTIMRILATVITPTSGSATIAGYDVMKKTEKVRATIGYMPQNFSLYPDLSVIENLNFFADIQGVSKERRQKQISELLQFTRLSGFKTRPADDLSGGMRKKLALACALVHEPEIILLDEPSTGVDPVSRREFWVILSEVVHRGVTVLISTPYMDEAERCHQVGILNRGHLLTSGSPAELEEKLPFDILEVKASPRRVMRQVVSEASDILEWRPVGDRLRLAVKDIKKVQIRLGLSLKKAGAEIDIMRQVKSTMEDVFIHTAETQEVKHE